MWGQKYEVKWPTYINTLFNTLVTAKTGQNCKTNNGRLICNSITQETLDELIKQLVIFDLRGFPSDNYLNHVIDSVFNTIPELANQRIPTSEQMHPTETTYKKQFKHQNVLHICYDILNGKDFSGTAKTIWERYNENLVPHFCLTDISHPFLTSEHPVFINDRIDGKKEQIFVALPTLLIVFGRGEKGQFSISNLTKAEVAYFNKAIIKNNKYIISCSKTVEI